jgi:hypothetical protein
MWSPVRAIYAANIPPLRVCFCLAWLLVAAAFSGCGYRLAADSPSIIGDGTRTLKVKGVDSPTLHPWLPHAIRSELRNEIGARHLARWVDSGSADYEIQINVINFSTSEWIRTKFDTSQLYSTSLTLEAIIYDGSTNKEIWRSGHLSYSEYEEHANEKAASGDIITQVIRRLADTMRSTF